MNRSYSSLLLLVGGGTLMLLAAGCTKEFSCPLGPGQGVCASISQVYANDPKAQPKPKPCDPFTEDCSTTKQGLASLKSGGTKNQYPILSNCNPYTEPCLANPTAAHTSAAVATGTAPTLPPPPILPPATTTPTPFPPMPHPGSAPMPPIANVNATIAGPQGTVRTGEPPFQAPVRIGERILRMWVPDWQDADGDLHAASYHYVQVAPSAWWPVESPPAQTLRSDRVPYPTPPRRLTNEQRLQLQTGSQTVIMPPPAPIPNPFPQGTTPTIAPPNQSAPSIFGTR